VVAGTGLDDDCDDDDDRNDDDERSDPVTAGT